MTDYATRTGGGTVIEQLERARAENDELKAKIGILKGALALASAKNRPAAAEAPKARTFSREEIGRMTAAEYRQHRETILAQLDRGEIK